MAPPKYNQDINVPQSLLDRFPQLADILYNIDFENEFAHFEKRANRNKFWFNWIGLLSLVLIVFFLLVITWKLGMQITGVPFPKWLVWVSALAGTLSFALAVSSTLLGLHSRWLVNRFATERFRQWKYQQLLDGDFILLSRSDPSEFASELKRRFDSLMFEFSNTQGGMNSFIKAENEGLYVNPSSCNDAAMLKSITEAYRQLRLDYEVRYFSLKQKSLQSLDDWSKSLAKFTLLSAAALAVSEVVWLMVHVDGGEDRLSWILGASAITAAIISAAFRVFRSAMAISEETERFFSKWIRFKILSERFLDDCSPDEALAVMKATEKTCVEELREFLRTFEKADYLL
jgi:hypothetical protein